MMAVSFQKRINVWIIAGVNYTGIHLQRYKTSIAMTYRLKVDITKERNTRNDLNPYETKEMEKGSRVNIIFLDNASALDYLEVW